VLVLIAAADVDFREVLAETVSALGLRAVQATKRADAPAVAVRETPALVLLELMTPVLDGFETRRRPTASPTLRDVPVAAVGVGRNRRAAPRRGADDVVAEPVDPATVEGAVRRWPRSA